MVYARIVSTGIYVPRNVYPIEEIARIKGLPLDEGMVERTGVRVKCVSSPDETPAYMAAEACKMALRRAGVSPEEVDLIIVATDTPEYITPPTAAKVHKLLGAEEKLTGIFDVNASCAGPAVSLAIASKFIMTEPETYRNVLVAGVYGMTRFLKWENPAEILFSDGAGAALLQASDEPGFLASKVSGTGKYYDYWGVYVGGAMAPCNSNVSRVPELREVAEPREQYLRLLKPYPPVNYWYWPELVRDVVSKIGKRVEDIDLVIFTQVRLRTIMKVMSELKLPPEKTHWVMHKYGYTGSACIFQALHDAVEEGKLKRGSLLVMVSSGVGLQMASVAFRW